MPKSLITGGAGFIGSHISDLLIEKGHKVIIVDNLSSGNKKNINQKAIFYEMDIQDPKISNIFQKEKLDFVFHLAAQINVRASTKNPMEDAKINVIGSLNIFENAARYNAEKVIFASTGGAIYGKTEIIPTSEDQHEKPLSPYGIGKLAAEKYLYYYKEIKNLDYIILRLANVYGPRQNSLGEAGVVSIFIDKLFKNEQPIINGDGKQTRDYVFVKDAAKAFAMALEKKESGIFNIGTGIETNVNGIFEKISSIMKSSIAKKYGPKKEGEQKRSCLNFQKAKNELGWSPAYDIDQGIKETVEWFKHNN